jgi:hypothetical protein
MGAYAPKWVGNSYDAGSFNIGKKFWRNGGDEANLLERIVREALILGIDRWKVIVRVNENNSDTYYLKECLGDVEGRVTKRSIRKGTRVWEIVEDDFTRGWTRVDDYVAYCGNSEGIQLHSRPLYAIRAEARGYGGYTTGRGDTWIRVQTFDPNEMLVHMVPQSGTQVYISPGASKTKLENSGFNIVWSPEDAPGPEPEPEPEPEPVPVETMSESDEDAFGQFAPGVPGHGGVEDDDETDGPVLATVKRNKSVSLSPRVMETSDLSSETAALWNRECRSEPQVSAWLPDSQEDIEFWNNW